MNTYDLKVFCICNPADSLNERLNAHDGAGSESWKNMMREWFHEYWELSKKLGFLTESDIFDPDEKYVRVWVKGGAGDEWMDRCESSALKGDFNLSDHGISDKFRDELGLYQREGTHHNPFLHYVPARIVTSVHEGDSLTTVINGVAINWTFSQKGERGSGWGDWDWNVKKAMNI